MNSHLASARSCSWYSKGKLRQLDDLDNDDNLESLTTSLFDAEEALEGDEEAYDPQQDPDIDMDFGPYGDEMDFLPDEQEEPQAGPGPQTAKNRILQGANQQHYVLDDNDDKRVTVIDQATGRIHRRVAPPTYFQADKDGDTMMDNASKLNHFALFASELDWKVAQWVVKDGPGHNAVNRLFKIPGVRHFYQSSFILFDVFLGR